MGVRAVITSDIRKYTLGLDTVGAVGSAELPYSRPGAARTVGCDGVPVEGGKRTQWMKMSPDF